MQDVAEVLLEVGQQAREDDRPPARAVQTLWSRVHSLAYARPDGAAVMSEAFRALGREVGVSDIAGGLGNVLRSMTAAERADLCERAARAVMV